MKKRFPHLYLLFKRLALVYGVFFLCRLFFFLFNFNPFGHQPLGLILQSFAAGLIFDTSTIVYVFGLFILLHALPFKIRNYNCYQGITKAYFLFVLLLCVVLNIIDSAFFPFSGRRSGIEIFNFVNDISDKLGTYVSSYWFLVPLPLVLVWAGARVYPSHKQIDFANTQTRFWSDFLLFVLICGISLLGARGGTGLRPISAFDAARYADVKMVGLTLNTPFQLLMTTQQVGLEPKTYFDDATAKQYLVPIHPAMGKPSGKNVVVIIVESLGKEYIGFHNQGKGYTPFIDSLMSHSLVYTHAYANGRRSIEGVAAILAAMPSLLNDNYISSKFQSNKLRGIGDYLQEIGYDASFYHGGKNGTMSFNNFVAISNNGNYFGLNEYPESKRAVEYDGNWGIYDEPYLQHWASELDQKKPPFFSTVFTLSSHHPYTIPANRKAMFAEGTIPIHKAIRYADYSLRKFFETAKAKPWYKNTVFVFTADHSSQNETAYYQSLQGSYEIPIFVFDPMVDSLKLVTATTQQADMLSMVMAETYDKPFYALSNFGTSRKGFAVQYYSGTYQLVQWPFVYLFDGEKPTEFFDLRTDSLMQNNILNKSDTETQLELDKMIKSYIQQYNQGLILNKTHL